MRVRRSEVVPFEAASSPSLSPRWLGAVLAPLALLGALAPASAAAAPVACARTISANVVAIDSPILFNRLGAQNPNWIIYALAHDVVPVASTDPTAPAFCAAAAPGVLTPGCVRLRDDKRPRPITIRVAAGDCLDVNFTNLLAPNANPNNAINPANPRLKIDDQVAERRAGFHVQGLELRGSIASDASNVGNNVPSLAAPGASAIYRYFAPKESTHLITNPGATFGGDASAGNSGSGMFGTMVVEPAGASFYRGQLTEEEMRLASTGTTPGGHPVLDYEARYPSAEPWITEGKAGRPIVNMLDGTTLWHTDINAIVVGSGPNGSFPPSTYPLESVGKIIPSYPNRLEPFREFVSVFHDENSVGQAFPAFYLHPVTGFTLHGVRDTFMINYGSGGVGSEIIANRLGVGPMHDCLDCSYEEFFLTSFAVGDVALLVDVPANIGLENVGPGAAPPAGSVGPKATKAFYPDDPSNVHHSYTGDFAKFRNVHTGKEHHIFHLHNHQWLFNPNDDNSNYVDAEALGPGSGYTYEIANGGGGNRNKSSGDAIFHCHFYPHFAQGMWYMWRHHDVFEAGSALAASDAACPAGIQGNCHSAPFALKDGTPAPGARALPDPEIVAGTPIPALVPLPGKPLPPMPGRVTVVANTITTTASAFHATSPGAVVPVGSLSLVDRTDRDPECVPGSQLAKCDPALNPTGLKNPGYPFWIAGMEDMVGQRPPTPPMDMDPAAGGFDGGLPRHALLGYASGGSTLVNNVSRLDFTKIIAKAKPVYYPEEGTDLERVGMAFHAQRRHPGPVLNLSGAAPGSGDFILNGVKPVPGAPFSDPCVDDNGVGLAEGQTWQSTGGSTGIGNFRTSDGGTGFTGAGTKRAYKGANVQFDAVLNKAGYHYPQQRIIALWEDVMPTILKTRPPEPLVMRNNTLDCTMFSHTNLVPEIFELDDYQIRTPTDIIGQHIHLPKWDLTTADGAANGWNYEDGTLSPGAVRERIEAINHFNDEAVAAGGTAIGPRLEAAAHPYFGQFGKADWLGARTTLQRWFFDPLLNAEGVDRGLGVVFTHDHYGPSTHQQIGLYATVLVEPVGSTWVHNETGAPLHTRGDGGPTSWQAAILTGDLDADGHDDSYREFYLEFSDFQHAYLPGVYVGRDQAGDLLGPHITSAATPPPSDATTFRSAINPPYRQSLAGASAFPDVSVFPPTCPGGVPRPCPEAITADDSGMLVVNYRNEPVGLRVFDPAALGPDGKPGRQAAGKAGDLAYALQSRTDRKIAAMNVQPTAATALAGFPPVASATGTRFPPPINAGGVLPGDPFTPMPRAYFGDRLRLKVQAGAHEHSHATSIHGMKWLQGGSGFGFAPDSGWRNSQHAGISEQFSLAAPVLPALGLAALRQRADYLYTINPGHDGWWSGTWGIIRTYGQPQPNLFTLPNTPTQLTTNMTNFFSFAGVCPINAPNRSYDITAVLANQVLPNALGVAIVPADRSGTGHVGGPLNAAGGTLVYNPLNTQVFTPAVAEPLPGQPPLPPVLAGQGPLHDPTAMMYVRTSDLDAVNPRSAGCFRAFLGRQIFDPTLATCAVRLKPTAPVEPIVLRAAAGECVTVILRNRLPASAPDLGGYTEYLRMVPRDRNGPQGMTNFNGNLVQPSSQVGLHAQLVAFDVTTDDGAPVGENPEAQSLVAPGQRGQVRFYAGDLSLAPTGAGRYQLVATPVEFGGANLGPADKLKQAAKGLVGAVVIEPPGSTWVETDRALDRQTLGTGTRLTRASATVNGTTRSFAHMIQKGQNHRYRNGSPVPNIAAEGGTIPEDSEDAGQVSINYGTEPMWFRFGLAPNVPFGGAGLGGVPNAGDAYATSLTGRDPATPVFTAAPGQQVKLRLLNPSGVGRGSVMTLHGHVWQRSPYVCPGDNQYGLIGACKPTGWYPTLPGQSVGSRAIGDSKLSFYLGAQDQVLPGSHFELFLPSAGGSEAVPGDYLFRDVGSFGNTSGIWSLMRVK
ncbi:MAG: hypothetical protein IPQ24_17605 [Anaeromyxobacter sp.]|nr:hypothetical protein [Anaeromyxobacter sp.]